MAENDNISEDRWMQVDADFSDIMDVPLESKPCSVAFSTSGQYLYIGSTSKELDLYTVDGLHLSQVAKKGSWIWAVAPRPNSDTGLLQVACGCEDGSLSLESVSVSTVHALYKVSSLFALQPTRPLCVRQQHTIPCPWEDTPFMLLSGCGACLFSGDEVTSIDLVLCCCCILKRFMHQHPTYNRFSC